MSDNNGSTLKENVNPPTNSDPKGKGKAVAEPETHDVTMEGDDSSDEDELEVLDETAPVADDEDDDNMEEIDPDNIITGGRRTRGRQIDFAKAAAELPEEDDDEDDDDDFEGGDEDDKMEE